MHARSEARWVTATWGPICDVAPSIQGATIVGGWAYGERGRQDGERLIMMASFFADGESKIQEASVRNQDFSQLDSGRSISTALSTAETCVSGSELVAVGASVDQ